MWRDAWTAAVNQPHRTWAPLDFLSAPAKYKAWKERSVVARGFAAMQELRYCDTIHQPLLPAN